MNPGFEHLQPYPFQRLAQLTAGIERADVPSVALTIGEPQHQPPAVAVQALTESLADINRYPATTGSAALRSAIADWLVKRFDLQGIDSERHIIPVNGTREALFSIAQALVTPGADGRVISPNPFYQIYEGAALLAGGRPLLIPASKETNFQPDFASVTEAQWQQCELLYLCTPGNPSGAVIPQADLQTLIQLAQRHRFVIASDECYSEIYPDEQRPPVGLLEAAAAMGNHDYTQCLVFHSLSKRSNLPGLRSGFVAGDADVIAQYLRYRTYHGCAMPLHHQAASIAAWQDEAHVQENRSRYRSKFDRVIELLSPVLPVKRPEAGFYLWPETPVDDERFAIELLRRCNVAVLPGRYLGREVNGSNPGANHARLALVAEQGLCVEAASRIADALRAGW